MAKKLKLTEKIKTALKARGVDDFESVSVFECVVASTRPISQKHSIYDGARMTPEMLKAMATFQTENSVPLQTMHDNYALPTGQVLLSEAYTEGFDTELNAVFYIEAGSEYESKLDNGIIDEVSVGALSQHARCSKCGFDFFKSSQAKMQLVWERTCDNDHVLGQDGTHLILDGIESWKELSLVPKGASSRPKILKPDEAKIANDDGYRQLAASGFNPELLTLHASATQPQPPKEGSTMDETQLMAQLSDTQRALGSAEAKLSARDEQITELKNKVTSLETTVAELSQEPNELQTQLSAVTSELEDVKTSKTTVEAFLSEHYKKACALLGQEAKEGVETQVMLDTVNDARLALHQIPVGGVGDNTPNDPIEADTPMYASSAFQTQR